MQHILTESNSILATEGADELITEFEPIAISAALPLLSFTAGKVMTPLAFKTAAFALSLSAMTIRPFSPLTSPMPITSFTAIKPFAICSPKTVLPLLSFTVGGPIFSPLQFKTAMPIMGLAATQPASMLGLRTPIAITSLQAANVFAPAQRQTAIAISSYTAFSGRALGVLIASPISITNNIVFRVAGAKQANTVMPIFGSNAMSIIGGRSLSSPIFIAGSMASYVVNGSGFAPVVTTHGAIFGPIVELIA